MFFFLYPSVIGLIAKFEVVNLLIISPPKLLKPVSKLGSSNPWAGLQQIFVLLFNCHVRLPWQLKGPADLKLQNGYGK